MYLEYAEECKIKFNFVRISCSIFLFFLLISCNLLEAESAILFSSIIDFESVDTMLGFVYRSSKYGFINSKLSSSR